MTGCSKDKTTENNQLVGKWKLKEGYMSNGSNNVQWTPVQTADQSIIEFHADSSFTYTPNFSKANLELNKFSLVGDALMMSSTLNSNTDRWYIRFRDNKRLELSILRCFEGCYSAFIAVK